MTTLSRIGVPRSSPAPRGGGLRLAVAAGRVTAAGTFVIAVLGLERWHLRDAARRTADDLRAAESR
jgi:hypothetical protein